MKKNPFVPIWIRRDPDISIEKRGIGESREYVKNV